MKAVRMISVALLIPLLAGCGTLIVTEADRQRWAAERAEFDSTLASWHGSSERQLVGRWGRPTSTYDYAGGGRELEYHYHEDGGCYYSQMEQKTNCYAYDCSVHFGVDGAGTITDSRWDGSIDTCKSGQLQ